MKSPRQIRLLLLILSLTAATLVGELVLPASPSAAPRPAIVFLVGSGPNSTYGRHYRNFCQAFIEPVFLPRGFAILYFDKRGVGASTGKWFTTDFDARTRDALAAVHFLRAQPGIDAARVGLVGHSQGAWIAELGAARHPDDVAFAIALNGAPYGVRLQLINDYKSEFLCAGLAREKAHAKAVRKARLSLAAVSVFFWKDNWKQLRLIKKFDPAEDIRRVRVPTLFVWAENDELVDPEWSLQRMQELFPQGTPPHFRFEVIAGATHSLRLAARCSDSRNAPYATEVVAKLNRWLDDTVDPHPTAASAGAASVSEWSPQLAAVPSLTIVSYATHHDAAARISP